MYRLMTRAQFSKMFLTAWPVTAKAIFAVFTEVRQKLVKSIGLKMTSTKPARIPWRSIDFGIDFLTGPSMTNCTLLQISSYLAARKLYALIRWNLGFHFSNAPMNFQEKVLILLIGQNFEVLLLGWFDIFKFLRYDSDWLIVL